MLGAKGGAKRLLSAPLVSISRKSENALDRIKHRESVFLPLVAVRLVLLWGQVIDSFSA